LQWTNVTKETKVSRKNWNRPYHKSPNQLLEIYGMAGFPNFLKLSLKKNDKLIFKYHF
jgi:hypothetical protein